MLQITYTIGKDGNYRKFLRGDNWAYGFGYAKDYQSKEVYKIKSMNAEQILQMVSQEVENESN